MNRAPRPSSDKAQRLRIRFARGPEAGTLGPLDMSRVWERALREAGIEVSYSEANRPQARLTAAAGLATGVTSESELVDVVLARAVAPGEVVERLRAHLPEGVELLAAWEVGIGAPSLPASLRWADYDVDVATEDVAELRERIDSFLKADTIDWEDVRGEKVRRYDLRALVQDLRIERHCDGMARVTMRLQCDATRAGRPDQVVKALGLPEATRIHRTGLVVAGSSGAREAWRRRGRFLI